MDTYAKRLRARMIEEKISAPTLAGRVGVTKQAIYKHLRGGVLSPDTDVLQKICEVLSVRPEWLVAGKLPKHPTPKLKDDETKLILDFRALSPTDRQRLIEIAESWKRKNGNS